MSLELLARCTETAGGADEHKSANQFAVISGQLRSDTAACRRADKIDRCVENFAISKVA